jgi:hypothetical protein
VEDQECSESTEDGSLNHLHTLTTDSQQAMPLTEVEDSLTLTEVLDNGGKPDSEEHTQSLESESETERIAADRDLLELESWLAVKNVEDYQEELPMVTGTLCNALNQSRVTLLDSSLPETNTCLSQALSSSSVTTEEVA